MCSFFTYKKRPDKSDLFSVGEKIRTPGLLVRSQTLYPAELRPHIQLSNMTIQMLFTSKCRRPESNRYERLVPQDFKSCASASSATPALWYILIHNPNLVQPKLHFTACKPVLCRMGGEGFEPSKAVPADLQSVPFGHSGIHP